MARETRRSGAGACTGAGVAATGWLVVPRPCRYVPGMRGRTPTSSGPLRGDGEAAGDAGQGRGRNRGSGRRRARAPSPPRRGAGPDDAGTAPGRGPHLPPGPDDGGTPERVRELNAGPVGGVSGRGEDERPGRRGGQRTARRQTESLRTFSTTCSEWRGASPAVEVKPWRRQWSCPGW